LFWQGAAKALEKSLSEKKKKGTKKTKKEKTTT